MVCVYSRDSDELSFMGYVSTMTLKTIRTLIGTVGTVAQDFCGAFCSLRSIFLLSL